MAPNLPIVLRRAIALHNGGHDRMTLAGGVEYEFWKKRTVEDAP